MCSTPPETNNVSGTTLKLACGLSAPQERTVRSSLFSPNQRNNLSGTKLRLAGGPSAPHGRTVRRSTLKPTPDRHPFWYTFEVQWRTVRPPGPDRPRAHQRHCKLSGTSADCPPLWCGLSASPPEPLQVLWNGRGLSAPLVWTVRRYPVSSRT